MDLLFDEHAIMFSLHAIQDLIKKSPELLEDEYLMSDLPPHLVEPFKGIEPAKARLSVALNGLFVNVGSKMVDMGMAHPYADPEAYVIDENGVQLEDKANYPAWFFQNLIMDLADIPQSVARDLWLHFVEIFNVRNQTP